MDIVPDQNWVRWIFSSLGVYFESQRSDIPFFVEGQIRDPSVTDYAELRTNGPYFNQLSRGAWQIDLLVIILIQIVQNDDIYKLDRYLGVFTAAYKTDISIFKLGDGEEDNEEEELGCLRLVAATGEKIRIEKFGQIQAANRIAQATIEARYRLALTD